MPRPKSFSSTGNLKGFLKKFKPNFQPLGDKAVYLKGTALLNTLRAVHHCCKENRNNLCLLENEEERSGHIRSLYVSCS